jgi:hypothetical protein
MVSSCADQYAWGMIRHMVVRCASLSVVLAAGVALADPPTPLPAEWRRSEDEQLPPNLWTRSRGDDWPSFLGPNRNGRSAETGILTEWPATGPRIVWQRESGSGYAAGSVSRGRYFHFERVEDRARLICLHAELGTELWSYEYPTDFVDMYGYDGGPRSAPVVDGDRVYIFGAEGMLHCLRVTDGSVIWKCDTMQQFGVVKNFFGVGSTPAVEGDLLITMVGGSPAEDQSIPDGQLDKVRGNGTGIVAFDKFTGAVKYALTNELASYASPVVATVRDRRRCFAFCRGGLVVFLADTGAVNFRVPWRSELLESANATTPVVVDNEVLISETYGPGSCLISVEPAGYQFVWRDSPTSRRKALQSHFSTPVYDQGYLYGCSGRYIQDNELRCVNWRTGQVMWSKPTHMRSALLYVDRHLVNLEERGKLQLIKANPQQFELVAEATLRRESGAEPASAETPPPLLKHPAWAAPLLSHGLLYMRGADRLVCVELIADSI